jgi:hypothetical protein
VALALGLSEGAVEARLHRGKLALRRLLTTELREDAAAYGLVAPERGAWQATRIWCLVCGQRRLWGAPAQAATCISSAAAAGATPSTA